MKYLLISLISCCMLVAPFWARANNSLIIDISSPKTLMDISRLFFELKDYQQKSESINEEFYSYVSDLSDNVIITNITDIKINFTDNLNMINQKSFPGLNIDCIQAYLPSVKKLVISGNNKTISNLYMQDVDGFIPSTSAWARKEIEIEIENLNFSNYKIHNSGEYTGGLIGIVELFINSKLTIKKCNIKDDCEFLGRRDVGGLIGKLYVIPKNNYIMVDISECSVGEGVRKPEDTNDYSVVIGNIPSATEYKNFGGFIGLLYKESTNPINNTTTRNTDDNKYVVRIQNSKIQNTLIKGNAAGLFIGNNVDSCAVMPSAVNKQILFKNIGISDSAILFDKANTAKLSERNVSLLVAREPYYMIAQKNNRPSGIVVENIKLSNIQVKDINSTATTAATMEYFPIVLPTTYKATSQGIRNNKLQNCCLFDTVNATIIKN